MQDLNINITIEDKLRKEIEEVKFALQVEENDNEYNCAEKDRLKEENERLRDALERIKEHGIPQSGSSEKTWISCIMNIDSIARNALAPYIKEQGK